LEEYRHPELISVTGRQLELDFFYPKLNVAVEYQGKQHYIGEMNYYKNQRSFAESKEKDVSKHALCKEKGETGLTIVLSLRNYID
jgi:hypothetical protein